MSLTPGIQRGAPETAAQPAIQTVIAQAARETGVSFDYLLKTAQRESGLNPGVKASTSSAAGLYQFIEQTWLGVMDRHSAKYGAGEAADQITRRADGRYEVADRQARADILAQRFDPALSATMAAELTGESAGILETRLGRSPSDGELYAAHFLGASGAARLIQAVESDGGQIAADLFPRAAEANTPIFYERDGTARSVEQVLANLTAKHDGEAAANPPAIAPQMPISPVVTASSAARAYAPPPQAATMLSPEMVLLLAGLDPLASIERG